MEDKLKMPKGFGNIEAKPATVELKPARPVMHAQPKEVAPGIVFIAHRKIYHAEFKAGGRMLNVGNFDTLEAAQAALSREKATYNL
jgi:hypothetical protein